MSMSDLDIMHARADEARESWYSSHDDTWLCRDCHRLVEYTPAEYAGPCDHPAYCARCVRDEVAFPLDYDYGDKFMEGDAEVHGCPKQCSPLHPAGHKCWVAGKGAQSYAAHVAAGTLR